MGRIICKVGALGIAPARRAGRSARLGVSRDMVAKWRARFLQDRLDGLPESFSRA